MRLVIGSATVTDYAIGFALVGRGATVILIDRGHPGIGASCAAAGVVAPFSEAAALAARRSVGTLECAGPTDCSVRLASDV
jgi:glycine/D-amino acid oxidase-like deaminating enzyme